jgi:uncharacterized protein Yka (UPF0111/DUF47 family)
VLIVGQIDITKLNGHWNNVKTNIALTNERIVHIMKDHSEDFQSFSENINEILHSPDVILDDVRSNLTGMFIKRIELSNINVIVKLSMENDKDKRESSILTMHRIHEREVKRLMKKYPVVYKSE